MLQGRLLYILRYKRPALVPIYKVYTFPKLHSASSYTRCTARTPDSAVVVSRRDGEATASGPRQGERQASQRALGAAEAVGRTELAVEARPRSVASRARRPLSAELPGLRQRLPAAREPQRGSGADGQGHGHPEEPLRKGECCVYEVYLISCFAVGVATIITAEYYTNDFLLGKEK